MPNSYAQICNDATLEAGRGRLQKTLRSLLLPNIDAVMVNGESGARYIRTFGYPDECIVWVPQTINVRRLSSAPLDKPSPAAHRLLYAGQMIELIGLVPFTQLLVEWCCGNPIRSIEFYLTGDGSHRTPPKLVPAVLGRYPLLWNSQYLHARQHPCLFHIGG